MALQAFSVIIFLAIDMDEKRSLKQFFFNLLLLFTGFFLTNYYTSNLSSLYAAKVYEPELKYLTDIGRTNLKILEHSADIAYMLNLDLPKEFDGRFITGGNTELQKARLDLNMSYIYTTHDEFVDFLLFQQLYLKHPIAKKLDQELYSRAHYVTAPHRSPLIDHLNRYISRIRENGMLSKFIEDTKWDGILSGHLILLRDSEDRKPLTLEYFRYAFVLLLFGLLLALIIFLIELKICVFKDNANFRKIVSANILQDIKPLYEIYNSESLAIVWFNVKQINNTFELLDRLLWRRHFKDILLIYEREGLEKQAGFNRQLIQIFQKCWSKGFISVLLWTQQQLYTYHPYPNVKVLQLSNVEQFWNKSHLNNFHQRSCRLPFFQFPNQCYSYRNRQGELVRTGYFYKWLQLYLQYYNASIEHFSIDMWSGNVSQKEGLEALTKMGFCLIPIYLLKFHNYFDSSNVMYLSKVTLMVPNAKEISSSLYLILPLKHYIGLIIIASTIVLFVLMYFVECTTNKIKDLSKLAMTAFRIILFLFNGFGREKSIKHFLLHLLFLFTGIFLTNYYSSTLSSLFTSKVYKPPIKTFQDISRTRLTLLEYTADVDFMLNINIPQTIKQRLRTGNNAELYSNRQKLNMTYMYTVHYEFMDFLLFQQYYLKHPIARKLDEALFYRPLYVTVPHRSPLIDHLNRYLMRIFESGLVQKFLLDSKWDGVLSGSIKLMFDPELKKPLSLTYLYYGFAVWICGLLCATVSFVIEYELFAFKYGRRHQEGINKKSLFKF
ncbi:hypothetical protein FF38_06773 [Lucilia cuprina]|uniref:Ionotropic glutamate receptor C-terminal domain-containing protein n=1 Tax=Lucilia cuprina TaxID=7375 RepID=A0A0L0CRG7_LUCCU|nr:hypothetical protein FF38_06773 [Lucilia cuprina]